MKETNNITNITTAERIRQIKRDIELYEEAIKEAEGALDEAERELDEVLADACSDQL